MIADLELDGPNHHCNIPCESVTTVLTFNAGMVHSLISGRWLVGDLELEQPGNPRGFLTSGDVVQELGSIVAPAAAVLG